MDEMRHGGTVKKQYENSANLNTRISIHSKYSVNPMGFGNWVVSNYAIKSGMRILELGCGTGEMWKGHLALLEPVAEVVLTDFSAGMLASARELLGENPRITYGVADIQAIPFETSSFDMVIANMMLYHVPDMDKALSQVRRVLKKDGVFYCATYGEQGIAEYISGLLNLPGAGGADKGFTLQNGGAILSRFFGDVKRLNYEDALAVTNLDDLLDYIESLSDMSGFGNVKREDLRRILKAHTQQGVLHVPKEYGMFICKNKRRAA